MDDSQQGLNLPISVKRKIINLYVPMSSILNRYLDDHYEVGHSCYCPNPEHDNTDTPAAKFFRNSDGSESVYCWACQRNFSTWDAVGWFVDRTKWDMFFQKVWIQLPEQTREQFLNSFFEETSNQSFVKEWILKLDNSNFKGGTQSYGDFLLSILKSYISEVSK